MSSGLPAEREPSVLAEVLETEKQLLRPWLGVTFASRLVGELGGRQWLREELPPTRAGNILNYFEHAGNVSWGAFTGGVGIMAAGYVAERVTASRTGTVPTINGLSQRSRSWLAAGTLLAATMSGAGFNALTETEAGNEHAGKYVFFRQNPVPDPVDLVYGTAAAALAGHLISRPLRRRDA